MLQLLDVYFCRSGKHRAEKELVLEKKRYLIVGAGLTGLTIAYQLLKRGIRDFVLLEARSSGGGRIRTTNGIDLGATWFNDGHSSLNELLAELGIERFEQYTKGKSQLIYNSMAPTHFFQNDPGDHPSFRIVGGTAALIDALLDQLKDELWLDQTVSSITKQDEGLLVKTNQGAYLGDQVVVTLPPNIAAELAFNPGLPLELQAVMRQTHTWMSNAIKVGMTFKTAFWREKGLSGMVVGQINPVIELYDHSSQDGTRFALMGFVNEGLRSATPEERKARILGFLETCFGKEIWDYEGYEEKDWSADSLTAGTDVSSVYMSPVYGNPVFERGFLEDQLWFAGTETAAEFGGYLEGAVRSALRVSDQLLNAE